jgi:GH18 family chitinase
MRAIDWVVEKGAPKHKVVLGIPLYGRGTDDPSIVKTYAEVYKEVGIENDTIRVGTADELWINSPITAAVKARMAGERGCGGIFVWELGQDIFDEPGVPSMTSFIRTSLLETLAEMRGKPPPPLPPPPVLA